MKLFNLFKAFGCMECCPYSSLVLITDNTGMHALVEVVLYLTES